MMRWLPGLLGVLLSVGAWGESYFVPQLGHSAELTHIAFSPAGKFIATASEDASVRLWSRQGQVMSVLEHRAAVLQTAFVDEQSLVTLDRQGRLRAWHGLSEVSVGLDGFEGAAALDAVNRLAYHRPSGTLAVAGYRSLRWSTLTLSELRGERVALKVRSVDVDFKVNGMALSPSGQLAALASKEGWLALVDLPKQKVVYQQQLDQVFSTLQFADDERLVLGGSGITLFSVAERKVTNHLQNQDFWGVFSLAVSPAHNEVALLASGLSVVDLESGELRFSVAEMGPRALAWAPDGGQLLAGRGMAGGCYAANSGAGLFDRHGQGLGDLPPGFFARGATALGPDNTLAINSCDSNIQLWDLDSLAFEKMLEGHGSSVTDLAFTHRGQQLLSTSFDDTLRRWDIAEASGQMLARAETEYFAAVAARDDRYAWGDYTDGNTSASVRLAEGDQVRRLEQDFSLKIKALDFAPLSDHLLALDFDDILRVFSPDGQKRLAEITGPGRDGIEHFAIAPNGKSMVTASGNNLLRWQALPWQPGAKGKPEVSDRVEAFRIAHMGYAHSGHTLVTAQHRDVVIYAADTLEEVHRIGGLQPQQVFYSRGDKYLVVVSASGRITLLDPKADYAAVGAIQKLANNLGFAMDLKTGELKLMDETQRQPVLIKTLKDNQMSWSRRSASIPSPQ